MARRGRKRSLSNHPSEDTDSAAINSGQASNKRNRRGCKGAADLGQVSKPEKSVSADNDIDIDCSAPGEGEADIESSCTESVLNGYYQEKFLFLTKTVADLSAKVDFLLTFLGITGCGDLAREENVSDVSSFSNSLSITKSPGDSGVPAVLSSADGESSSNGVISAPDQPMLSVQLPVKKTASGLTCSFADAVKAAPPGALFRQSVISAVYRDMKSIEKRARNVVVTGLIQETDMDDKQVVNDSDILPSAFGRTFDIVACRRLGKQVVGRVQPLLLTFKSGLDASYLIDHAKKLRNSSNPTVRSSVYINHDLTRAQAKEAYDRRCRLRSKRVKIIPAKTPAGDPNLAISSTNAARVHENLSVVQSSQTISLNPPPIFPQQPSTVLDITVNDFSDTLYRGENLIANSIATASTAGLDADLGIQTVTYNASRGDQSCVTVCNPEAVPFVPRLISGLAAGHDNVAGSQGSCAYQFTT